MSKRFKALVGIILIALATLAFFKWHPSGVMFLDSISDNPKFLFVLITVSSLLDSVNPCAFSVLLITIAFLVSLGKSRQHIALIGSLYIFGIFVVYVLIGLGLLKALAFFGTSHFATKIGSLILILFGSINIINHYFPSFPIKLKIPDSAHNTIGRLIEKVSLPGAFILGMAVAMFEFPCTGGPYLFVLALLNNSATYANGLIYLLYYNLVFILPLVVILFLASDKMFYAKVEKWRKSENPKVRLVVNVAIILLGIIMFTL